MMYKELINDLKKIKSPQHIDDDIADHLTSAAIASYMNLFTSSNPEINEEEAFDMTRTMILKQLDFVLMEIMDQAPMGMGKVNENSPMNDPAFNEAIQKAIQEYNKNIDKK